MPSESSWGGLPGPVPTVCESAAAKFLSSGPPRLQVRDLLPQLVRRGLASGEWGTVKRGRGGKGREGERGRRVRREMGRGVRGGGKGLGGEGVRGGRG